jgi:hypothetical protein
MHVVHRLVSQVSTLKARGSILAGSGHSNRLKRLDFRGSYRPEPVGREQ